MSNNVLTLIDDKSCIRTISNAAGRITATRVYFTGDASTGKGTLRQQGKALDLKGNALNEWVHAMASGDAAAAARLKARALFNAALDKGAVPSIADFKPNGNAVFTLVPEAKAPATRTITCDDPVAMVAGMTPEQRAALLAALQA